MSISSEVASCNTPVELDHFIFSEEGWKRAQSLTHPTLFLVVTTDESDYKRFGYTYRKVTCMISVVPESCLWSRKGCLEYGFKMGDLIPVRHVMKSASRTPIKIDGAVIIRLSGKTDNGRVIQAAVIVYISPQASTFYMSKEAMVQLEIIHEDFPKVGVASNITNSNINAVGVSNTMRATCGCSTRTKAPKTTVHPTF